MGDRSCPGGYSALTFGVWGLFVAFAWERRTVEPKDPAQDQVGVTVFKPLKGAVPGLRGNPSLTLLGLDAPLVSMSR